MNRLEALRLFTCMAAWAGLCVFPAVAERTVILLDGEWQIAQSVDAQPPAKFEAVVPVPGLADMATPAFAEVGVKSAKRQYFWYRKTFQAPETVPAFAILKLHKAMYGTAVWINGRQLGENMSCFTPSYWDLRPYLKAGAENEILVRLGATREAIPVGMPSGWDFEKKSYIPGLYDSVEVILCDGPRIVNVQCVPDIQAQRVRLLVELEAGSEAVPCLVEAEVAEAKSGKVVATGSAQTVSLQPGGKQVLDLTLRIPECRLWWPEDPFLYQVRLKTSGDSFSTRLGMREFRFDPVTKRAVINGQQRYLLGSNICIHRFFEDSERLDRPWDREWVRKLHRQFKAMNWDVLRYCIGFPPELWYDIADEEGVLIQDEFPVWTLEPNNRRYNPEKLETRHLISQYSDWMRERWNHPCVVIWDAQNESDIEESGLALQAVRHLDYSNRPWDNGWGATQSPFDCKESHPYLFGTSQPVFRLSKIPDVNPSPNLTARQKPVEAPIIINEYDWLWINRDGTPTTLSKRIYDETLGKDATVEARRVFHARGVAALTEFWRAHRKAAGIFHFCGLGYSRPGSGQTSDDFIDVGALRFEPHFRNYVGMAFNPVGIMLDFWKETVAPESAHEVKVYVINDRQESWHGEVQLRIEGKVNSKASCEVAPLGQQILTLKFHAPEKPGRYTVTAELNDGGKPIQSLRDFEVKIPAEAKPEN